MKMNAILTRTNNMVFMFFFSFVVVVVAVFNSQIIEHRFFKFRMNLELGLIKGHSLMHLVQMLGLNKKHVFPFNSFYFIEIELGKRSISRQK